MHTFLQTDFLYFRSSLQCGPSSSCIFAKIPEPCLSAIVTTSFSRSGRPVRLSDILVLTVTGMYASLWQKMPCWWGKLFKLVLMAADKCKCAVKVELMQNIWRTTSWSAPEKSCSHRNNTLAHKPSWLIEGPKTYKTEVHHYTSLQGLDPISHPHTTIDCINMLVFCHIVTDFSHRSHSVTVVFCVCVCVELGCQLLSLNFNIHISFTAAMTSYWSVNTCYRRGLA